VSFQGIIYLLKRPKHVFIIISDNLPISIQDFLMSCHSHNHLQTLRKEKSKIEEQRKERKM